jgi:DNA-binding XRE family transcriptional regulator/tetratricopeptide (TPR) repeat protein
MSENKRMKLARLKERWSQEKAAEEAKISRKTYIELETGRRAPHIGTLGLLCSAFHASPQELGYNDLGQLLTEDMGTPPDQAVLQQPDGSIVFTREEAEWIAHLLHLGEKDMAPFDPSKRKTIQRLIAAAGTSIVVPQLPFSPEPWERLATGKPADVNATTLDHFEGLITSCRGLSNGDQLDIAAQVLPQFLPRLVQLAHYQTRAAGLAAQGLLLKSILNAHQLRLVDKTTDCQEAVAHAKQASDTNVLVASLLELGVAYQYGEKSAEALQAYQEALLYCKDASPVLQARTYVEAGAAFAKCKRGKEARFYLGLAYDTLPDHPEDDPAFIMSDYCGLYILSLYDGIIHLELGKPVSALSGFEKYKSSHSNFVVPERTRLEIVNHQGRAAILSKNLDKYAICLEDGVAGAIALKSQKRFNEAHTIFQQEMPAAWLRETSIKRIVEQYGLTTLNT